MQNDKPIIRHCRNCKYHEHISWDEIKCNVKYKYIEYGKQRIKALFCRYYKAKEGGKNATN